MSFKSSFENTNVALPDLTIFLWIAASVANAADANAADAAVNLNGIKMLLANGLSTLPIKGKPVFSNGPRSLPKKSPDCLILYNWVLDNFILASELFAKALSSLNNR